LNDHINILRGIESMDFIDEIKALSSRIPNVVANIKTEEATKNALVMPFINLLGYNVFNPTEVTPEFTADHGTKKGEKVDYAIYKDGCPIILIECKTIDSDLDKEHASQLFRYFNVCDAKVGILTNGIIYKFFSDLEATNKMDNKPFLEIDLLDIKEPLIEELKRFKKEAFNIDELTTVAIELKYTKEIKQILLTEMASPSEDFVKFFANKVYDGKITQNVRSNFVDITKNAFNQFINDMINERLNFAMSGDVVVESTNELINEKQKVKDNNRIITTEEEWQGYYIVKAILTEIIDPTRVSIRDTQRYCGILLDDNNRKPICRLYFNTKQKYIGIIDDEIDTKKEDRIPINELNEIYNLSDRLKNVVKWFDESEKK
jgi:hypothetical protein